MAFEFRLPDLGEGINEAQLLSWKVSPGQAVAAFDALCEVESAKAAVELTSPVAGRVLETRFEVGATAQRGDVLVLIDTDAAAAAGDGWVGIVGSPPRGSASVTPPSSPANVGPPPASGPSTPPAETGAHRVLAAPFVRKLARERGIDLAHVAGSGPQGRVRIADLDAQPARSGVTSRGVGADTAHRGAPGTPLGALAAEHATQSAERGTLPGQTVPLAGMRRAIADHLLDAWRTAPQVTTMDLLDVTELVRARDLLQPAATADGTHLTYLPFFVKASIEALRAVPEANATVDTPAQTLTLHADYHIGIATAIPGGLLVPVVRHADRLNLLELAREIERVVAVARERRSSPAELTGSTFTITSFGGLSGSPLFATPIVNSPEVAILGLGRIDLQPRVVAGEVVPRQCIGVSFTFDHRILDGASAGAFMAALRRYVEQPLELLLRLR